MSKACDICGKKSSTGFKVSHSNIKTKRKWKANIQRVRAMINGSPRRIKVCSQCIKSGRVQRA